jgi:arabinan endo-1,5-alpha-L-arabinosidase
MVLLSGICLVAACSKKDAAAPGNTGTDTTVMAAAFDINSIEDTYADVSSFAFYTKWGSYNVHDPSIKKFGDYYYCYSTDVGFGITVRSGIQIRKSKDLVQWQFVGWVFNTLPAKGAAYISGQGGPVVLFFIFGYAQTECDRAGNGFFAGGSLDRKGAGGQFRQ